MIQIYSPALEAEPEAAGQPQVRVFGVTQAVGGFAALPFVADELCYGRAQRREPLHKVAAEEI